MRDRYFDNAATTPLDPRVLREMTPFLEEEFGNASSIHGFGQRAAGAVESARERVAALIGAEDPSQIVFTSGATESNNWVLRNHLAGVTSPFEHAAVRELAEQMSYDVLENDGTELLPSPKAADLLTVMSVNNEIGTRWDVREITTGAAARHSDMTQSVGKLPTDVSGLDYASFSAHKFYGPKGVGGLFIAEPPLPRLLLGGDQENGMRAGTLNVPGIVGMGAAAAIAADEMERDLEHAQTLRDLTLDGLSGLSDWQVNGGEEVSPYILSLSFLGVEGESLTVELDNAGYAISAGAACSARATEPSHVLRALGLPEPWRKGTVRISFGRFNTLESTQGLMRTLMVSVENLRAMRRHATKGQR